MDQNITKNYTLKLRYKNSNKGFIIDFMSLNVENEIYPFINIYYFKDASSLHKHYIINIDGNLEIAHDSYKDNWIENSVVFPDNYSVDLLYSRKSAINDYNKKAYRDKIALTRCYHVYSDIETYLHLIRQALVPYISNHNIVEPISALINILKSADDYDIPVSDFKKNKTLIKK